MAVKFFAFEGIDGSGKGTQAKLLAERLAAEGFSQEAVSFPQHETETGKLIKEYLYGRFGDPTKFNPYIAATFFANDRYATSAVISRWLKSGTVVVANRYVASNLAHQGAKFTKQEDLEEFLRWVWEYEHTILKAPLPFYIYLRVSVVVSQELKRQQRLAAGQNPDGHEANVAYLSKVAEVYDSLMSRGNYLGMDVATIDCCENDQMLPRKVIHDKVWQVVKGRLS